MSSTAELQVLYTVGNAPIRHYPFPHLYVPEVFPKPYYAELQRNLPDPRVLRSLEDARGTRGYPERSVMALDGKPHEGMAERQVAFWRELWRWMLGGRLGHLVLQKFSFVIEERLKSKQDFEIGDEALLVYDRTRYSLGPHTDSPLKIASLLFYLPADDRLAPHGTSLYLPKQPGFTCDGRQHHPFAGFDRVATMPFLPNALFAFPKTDNSFHGVEPFDVPDAGRWLLLFDLRLRQSGAAPSPGPTVSFKF